LIFAASTITAGLLALLIVMVSSFIPNAAVALKCVKQWDAPDLDATVGTVLVLPACTVYCLAPVVSDILEN